MTYVLGLSFNYHDAAAALIYDGRVIAAADEERFSRRKHDHRFPEKAIAFCLQQAGISSSDLDHVAFYEHSIVKFDRIVRSALRAGTVEQSSAYLGSVVDGWMHEQKFDDLHLIADRLNVPADRISACSHHLSHAAAAFFPSSFAKATVVTMDGVGEYDTLAVWLGDGNTLTRLYGLDLPQSLGLFYSAFTAFLGFEVNEGEYKVMGMAGFGKPTHLDTVRSLIQLTDDGLFSIDKRYFEFESPADLPYRPALIDLLGPPREPESLFRVGPMDAAPEAGSVEAISLHYANIAASVQKVAEEAILHVVRHAVARTGVRNVCIAGGVGLNSLANGRVARELGCELYVHPAAGDSGTSLGAALNHYHGHLQRPRSGALTNPYLGAAYDDDDVLAALRVHRLHRFMHCASSGLLVKEAVDRLAAGKVIGWMQGRFEWGPRALGNRSILANPTLDTTKETVNVRIKFREQFRPFAPSVLTEHAHDYFDLPELIDPAAPENFMLSVAGVRPDKRHVIPAVTHVDGTARVQVVRRETNPLYYDLIEEFGRRTGVPVVLNTSFNMRGEPMVDKPYDALETFCWSDMDCLVMGNYIVDKEMV